MSLLSLAHMAVLELTPPEVVACAAAAGFDGVNLRLGPARPGERPWPMDGDAPMMRETLAVLRDTGLQVSDVEVIRLGPQTRADAYTWLYAQAERLGARRVIVVSDDPDPARAAASFATQCERADRHGLWLALEFMVFTEVRSLDQALALVEAADPANGGLLPDPLHMARSGSSWEALAGLDPRWLSFVQLCDAPRQAPEGLAALGQEARFDRLLPGEGGLPLAGFLAALPSGLDITVETPLAGERGRLPPQARARLMHTAARGFLAARGVSA